MSKITLILGGARSGKSQFAERLAEQQVDKLYLATGEASDKEMQTRIEIHQSRRGNDWKIIEEPLDIASKLFNEARKNRVILVDCLTLWLSNLMMAEKSPIEETDKLLKALENPEGHIIFVSNEVGLSIVPENKLARKFRDEQGILNQRLANRADNVVFIAAGLPLYLKEAANDS